MEVMFKQYKALSKNFSIIEKCDQKLDVSTEILA